MHSSGPGARVKIEQIWRSDRLAWFDSPQLTHFTSEVLESCRSIKPQARMLRSRVHHVTIFAQRTGSRYVLYMKASMLLDILLSHVCMPPPGGWIAK
jgi:hypothetical protein